jgi:hypothetical protein
MMDDGVAQARSSLWSAVATLFATSGTLVCCAIPALLVALGAGAALSSLVSVFPQVVWLSEHKEALFAVSGAALAISGWIQWRTRTAPCPLDPKLRDACLRTRRASRRVCFASFGFYLVGGWFAYVQPWISGLN